jgi:hypothetical protein
MASDQTAIDPRNWQQIHQELARLARSKGALDAEEATWLAAAVRGSVHLRLGLGSMREYLERLFGYTPRVAKERLRVAESLQALPAMRQALARGELTWSAVRELSRIATAETEPAWIDKARDKTVREVEQMVAGRVRGDHPTDRPRPEARAHLENPDRARGARRVVRQEARREFGGPK